MEETTTHRVKEAVAGAVEKAAEDPSGAYAVAELGKAYAAILDAESRQNAQSIGAKLLEEIKDL